MDVKEAITQLTGLKKYCEGMAECDESGSYVFDLDVQALDMAITALSPPKSEHPYSVYPVSHSLYVSSQYSQFSQLFSNSSISIPQHL